MASGYRPRISIITVCYNAQAVLERTLVSVASQTYASVEYVVVDGGSTDGTLALLEQYKAHIAQWYSGPDKGLYDAMNRGLVMATGELVCFMNAGDVLPQPDTLERAFAEAHPDDDFVYGRAERIDEHGKPQPWHQRHPEVVGRLLPWHFRWGMVVCHQSMYVRRTIAPLYRWERYSLVADLDWVIRCLQRARRTRDTGLVLTRFLEGGVSSRRRRRSWLQRWAIVREHFGWPTAVVVHAAIVWRAAWRSLGGGRTRWLFGR